MTNGDKKSAEWYQCKKYGIRGRKKNQESHSWNVSVFPWPACTANSDISCNSIIIAMSADMRRSRRWDGAAANVSSDDSAFEIVNINPRRKNRSPPWMQGEFGRKERSTGQHSCYVWRKYEVQMIFRRLNIQFCSFPQSPQANIERRPISNIKRRNPFFL
jgi:hypothetical protein